jgi:molecular chaperone GrpE
MSGSPSDRPNIRVSDKRIRRAERHESDAPPASSADQLANDTAPEARVRSVRIESAGTGQPEVQPVPPPDEAVEEQHDYLEDLKRLQAEFDNFRKRMIREQTDIAARAGARLVERLLPVLDSLERALEHSGESEGVALVRKELLNALRAEGLEEVDALNHRFDPHLHEAVESHEDPDVSEATVITVYRTGYRLGGRVLRPAMVGVARPAENTEQDSREQTDEQSSE